MFVLSQESNFFKEYFHIDFHFFQLNLAKKDNKVEWSWRKVKQGGQRPSERISYAMVTISDDSALLFGGVYDHMVLLAALKTENKVLYRNF